MSEIVAPREGTRSKVYSLAIGGTGRYREELIITAVGIAAFFLLPNDLGFLTRIAFTALFVLSLSFVLGQAGILTLGHAALFGSGAYAAGLTAQFVSGDPLLGLLSGGLVGASVAFLTGLFLLRTEGLTLLMLTVAVCQILYEIANKLPFTGGDDGLAAFSINPIFGVFRFDIYGRTGFLYALAVLAICFFLLKRLAASPFGLTCRGIKSDPVRTKALGCSNYWHLVLAYVVGGAVAGIAGAVSAQTVGVVGLNSLSFFLSAEALVMLILGGTGRLSGAVLGTIVFMAVHHISSAINPFHWLLIIGVMLIATILVLPGGLLTVLDEGKRFFRRRGVHQ